MKNIIELTIAFTIGFTLHRFFVQTIERIIKTKFFGLKRVEFSMKKVRFLAKEVRTTYFNMVLITHLAQHTLYLFKKSRKRNLWEGSETNKYANFHYDIGEYKAELKAKLLSLVYDNKTELYQPNKIGYVLDLAIKYVEDHGVEPDITMVIEWVSKSGGDVYVDLKMNKVIISI